MFKIKIDLLVSINKKIRIKYLYLTKQLHIIFSLPKIKSVNLSAHLFKQRQKNEILYYLN